MDAGYVHGYDEREAARLHDQASTLVELLHHDTTYAAGESVLEAGCGTGAQTLTLAASSPGARLTSVDISAGSVREATARVAAAGLTNVRVAQADVNHLPFGDATFDHAFVCFVLEHLPRPVEALREIVRAVRPGGTLTVIEGDHGSAYFHPDSEPARRAVQAQVTLQARAGGNANIGRALYPLLVEAGLLAIRVSPRMVYVDANRPALVDGFTRRTFTAMVAGVRAQAVSTGLMTEDEFDKGVRDLERTTAADGTFCYTFFKAVGIVAGGR